MTDKDMKISNSKQSNDSLPTSRLVELANAFLVEASGESETCEYSMTLPPETLESKCIETSQAIRFASGKQTSEADTSHVSECEACQNLIGRWRKEFEDRIAAPSSSELTSGEGTVSTLAAEYLKGKPFEYDIVQVSGLAAADELVATVDIGVGKLKFVSSALRKDLLVVCDLGLDAVERFVDHVFFLDFDDNRGKVAVLTDGTSVFTGRMKAETLRCSVQLHSVRGMPDDLVEVMKLSRKRLRSLSAKLAYDDLIRRAGGGQ